MRGCHGVKTWREVPGNREIMHIAELTSLSSSLCILLHSYPHAVKAFLNGTQTRIQEALQMVIGKMWEFALTGPFPHFATDPALHRVHAALQRL